jgi:hypothetical protein
MTKRVLGSIILVSGLAVACGGKTASEPPVATPGVSFNHTRAALGSPLEVTYRFLVAPGAAAFGQNYRVFVHFLDSNDELMWTDDHDPPTQTSEWKAGQTIEYTRTMFVPIYPYVGEAAVAIGLYSPGDQRRLPLAGQDLGQRAYRAASLQLLPQTENVFLIFKDGWHPAETAVDNPTIEWQWTKKEATIAFRNPRRDALVYLEFDSQWPTAGEEQTVTVLAGDQTLDTVSVGSGREILRKIPVAASQMGSNEMAELRIVVDKTFVPALLPAATTRDRRELGVRVFHAFLELR